MTIQESNLKIIELLSAGKVYKEVAALMGLSKWTIVDRVRSMKKLYSCKTVVELVNKVKENTTNCA